jgi:hypothetical protein
MQQKQRAVAKLHQSSQSDQIDHAAAIAWPFLLATFSLIALRPSR